MSYFTSFIFRVNANVATLCNYEVMTHLQKMKDTRKKQTGQLATITYEVYTNRYFNCLLS